ncbi:ATP-binding protein [Kitasatospora sp. NPDC056184]|uniref:ATP-binding protein n=1 Tax=Kitasatospora sp. NPDC056184 TaxID=3345738 RepID=UPI0035E243E6
MLRYRPEAARTARLLVKGKLGEWGRDDLTDAAEVVISELVANAVRTGCQAFMLVAVRRTADGGVRILVRDGSRELPVLIAAGNDEECHRGLVLVDELTGHHWGVTLHPRGKTIHADLAAP